MTILVTTGKLQIMALLGFLTDVVIMEKDLGYAVLATASDNSLLYLCDSKNSIKYFKSIDSSVKLLKKIGIRTARIELSACKD